MIALPSRQVHLDFHTSEHIPGVGAGFDKANFQAALKLGRLNSITVFAKCHHSWSYYPTKIGRPHPALTRDLLGDWIEASHEVGVRAPVYYTVGWSATEAETHPEWVSRHRDGSIASRDFDPAAKSDDPKPAGSWKFLCPSGEYRDLMLEQTREICSTYDVDGFFYDICFHTVCFCPACRSQMTMAGLDPSRDEQAREWHVRKWQSFMAAANGIIHARFPDATVFYNGGASQYTPEWHAGDTHFELEDLPTGWGGYDKFPLRARYFANTGRQYLAMSGKFHISWGEFGGFKHPSAIRAEAAAMIAWGARCSFGDQAHPSAAMDLATYRNIGEGYAYAQKIEGYGLDGKPCASLGLWLSGQVDHDQGTANMLLESQTDFEVIDASQGLRPLRGHRASRRAVPGRPVGPDARGVPRGRRPCAGARRGCARPRGPAVPPRRRCPVRRPGGVSAGLHGRGEEAREGAGGLSVPELHRGPAGRGDGGRGPRGDP